MPVKDDVHAQFVGRIDSFLDFRVHLGLRTLQVATFAWVERQTHHVDAPLVAQGLERVTADVLREPLHAMCARAAQLEGLAMLVEYGRRAESCRLADGQPAMLADRSVLVGYVLQRAVDRVGELIAAGVRGERLHRLRVVHTARSSWLGCDGGLRGHGCNACRTPSGQHCTGCYRRAHPRPWSND